LAFGSKLLLFSYFNIAGFHIYFFSSFAVNAGL
jgi:hypothetical protein